MYATDVTGEQPERRRARLVALGAIGFLLLHAIVAYVLPSFFEPVSTLFIIVAQTAAIGASVFVARCYTGTPRTLWLLLGLSLLLLAISMTLDAVAEWRGTANTITPTPQMLLSTFASLPILLAVSLRSKEGRHIAFRLMKVFLTLATGFLFYILILPIQSAASAGHSVNLYFLIRLFDVLNLFLCVAATIRIVGADEEPERRFFICLLVFLLCATLFDALHNRLLIDHVDAVWLDLFVSGTPLPLLVAIAATSSEHDDSWRPSQRLVRIVKIGRPVFLTMALLLLGLYLSQTHFLIGASGVILALGCYCAMNIMLHARAIEAEESLAAANQQLRELASTDALTGIPNRRAFDLALEMESRMSIRTSQPLALLLIDIDYFKLLNDTDGHIVGDKSLAEVATALHAALPRATDVLARYGGEEFALLLPATDAAGAMQVAERMHAAVQALALPHAASPFRVVTVSIGIAISTGQTGSQSLPLIEHADRALYLAKSAGRHQTVGPLRLA